MAKPKPICCSASIASSTLVPSKNGFSSTTRAAAPASSPPCAGRPRTSASVLSRLRFDKGRKSAIRGSRADEGVCPTLTLPRTVRNYPGQETSRLLEDCQVDGVGHGLVPGVVGVQVVAGVKLGADAIGVDGVTRGGIEIHHGVIRSEERRVGKECRS